MSEEKQFLYTIKPTRLAMLTEGPTTEESAVLSRHFNHLKTLTEQDVVIMAGRTQTADSDTFGIVIFKAASDEAAETILQTDPAVALGVMQAQLYPFRIALSKETYS